VLSLLWLQRPERDQCAEGGCHDDGERHCFLIFVFDGQVVWKYCLLAMVTCAVGGYTSARFARLVRSRCCAGR